MKRPCDRVDAPGATTAPQACESDALLGAGERLSLTQVMHGQMGSQGFASFCPLIAVIETRTDLGVAGIIKTGGKDV